MESMLVAVQRPEIFVAQTKIQVQLASDLNRVLSKQVECVNSDEAFRTPHGDRGSRNVASQEISQGTSGIAIRACSRPRSLGSIEAEFPGSPAVIELVHAALPDFTSETQLMPAYVVGNDVSQHSGHIVAAFRRSKTDLFKARYGDIRGAQDGLSLDGRVRAKEQAQCLGIEAVVGIAESLVEVVDSEQQLIRHPRGENRIKSSRVVVNVNGSFFEVKL